MAASPAAPADDGAPRPRATTLVEWLRTRPDAALARLLRLRPDLALPAPPDLTALAARITVRTSTQRAVDALDAGQLRALENLVLAAGDADTVDDPDPDALDDLFERALVWGDPDLVHVLPTVREAIGAYPAGLGRPASVLLRGAPVAAARLGDSEWLAAQLAALDDEERAVLDQLAGGPPLGTVGDTRHPPGGPDIPAPFRLVERGLLVPVDATRVELPREVGVAVRASTDIAQEPPELPRTERTPAELDALGTTAVLETLRRVESLAESWSANPPAILRGGGVGVRDLRRTAKDLDVDEATTAVLVETAYAAGLVNVSSGTEPVFLPSESYDEWRTRPTAQRWVQLASGWLAMTRQPALVGQRGERDRMITALGPDAERGTAGSVRRQVLDVLAALSPGSAPASRADVLAVLAWRQPRRAAALRPALEAVLAEADLLGVTAAGGLTGYSRTLLAGGAVWATGSALAEAERALDRALPAPVDHFLVQPDLTLVVPGPPEPAMGIELALVADLESSGGASVYRITEASVRRALDAGRRGSDLAAFVAARSRTPVPQALQYLIDDVARRHGRLRAGTASAYLRCEDEALLARVLADRDTAALGLRLLAPTVAICEAPVARLLDGLRAAGFAPAAESPDGEVISLDAEPLRAPDRPAARVPATRSAGAVDPAELVRRLRATDSVVGTDERMRSSAAQVPGVTTAGTIERLRAAVREAQRVLIGYAEADGRIAAHTLEPISLAAGTVRGYEPGRAGLASYQLHRITAVRVLADDDAGSGPDDLPFGRDPDGAHERR